MFTFSVLLLQTIYVLVHSIDLTCRLACSWKVLPACDLIRCMLHPVMALLHS